MSRTLRFARTSGAPALTLAMSLVAILGGSLVASPAVAQDESRSVGDGGIAVPGWTGRIDAREAERGSTLQDARFVEESGALHATTGPATTYWNPSNTASGAYTVSATFTEPAFMGLNNHAHPYGIVVAGNDLGTDQQSYLYCATYGNGSFIVRGFGPEPFQLNGRRAEAHDAVNKAAAEGDPVTQHIAVSVDEDSVDCAVNGTVVASYPVSEVVTEGRLRSTDGVYGVRFGHNTEAVVEGLSITRR